MRRLKPTLRLHSLGPFGFLSRRFVDFHNLGEPQMRLRPILRICVLAIPAVLMITSGFTLHAQQSAKPNIIFIRGDDVGWSNIGVYNQGIMAVRTPNLDRLAAEGMRFTDYYAEASCTAGRANFITGELPIRTGLTTVGQAGSPLGIPNE